MIPISEALYSHLKEKFKKQMGAGTGSGTLNRKEAERLGKKFNCPMEVVAATAKRFGVLIDDPFAERITSYTKGVNSPHGKCFSTMTGEVFCEANVGEDETPLPWGGRRSDAADVEGGSVDAQFGWSKGFGGAAVVNVLDKP